MTLLATVMLLALGGCNAAPSPTPATVTPAADFTEFYADENITGEVAAPTAVVAGKRVGDGDAVGDGDGDAVGDTGDAVGVLALQLRLHNHGDREVALTESTRCTVLRWTIIDARGNPVQTMPNRRCAQQLATRTLRPAQTIARIYELPLPTGRGRHTVRFSFWNYPGEHAFEAR